MTIKCIAHFTIALEALREELNLTWMIDIYNRFKEYSFLVLYRIIPVFMKLTSANSCKV